MSQETGSGALEALRRERFSVLTTRRRDGTAVPTTVWHVVRDEKIYLSTPANTGKVKRLRRDPTVTIAASDRGGRLRGTPLEGRARFLEGTEAAAIEAALRRRYGLSKRAIDLWCRLRRVGQIVVEVSPVPTAPDIEAIADPDRSESPRRPSAGS